MLTGVIRPARRVAICTVCAAIPLIVGCGSSSNSPTAPSGSPGNSTPVVTPHGSMSATIDGARWDAKAGLTVVHSGGSITLGGSDVLLGPMTSVNLSFPDGVGSHPVASAGLTFADVMISNALAGAPLSTWSSAVGGSSGTITVTTSTASGAAGTFQLSLPGFGKTTGTKNVTNGVFNVTF